MWWYGGPWNGMMGSWWGLHFLMNILFWVGIVALVLIVMQMLATFRGRVKQGLKAAKGQSLPHSMSREIAATDTRKNSVSAPLAV